MLYLAGDKDCPATFCNTPSLHETTKHITPNVSLQESGHGMLDDVGFLHIVALVDIKASPENPVELWIECYDGLSKEKNVPMIAEKQSPTKKAGKDAEEVEQVAEGGEG